MKHQIKPALAKHKVVSFGYLTNQIVMKSCICLVTGQESSTEKEEEKSKEVIAIKMDVRPKAERSPKTAATPPKTAERPTTQQSMKSSRGESRQEKVSSTNVQCQVSNSVCVVTEKKREEDKTEIATQYRRGSTTKAEKEVSW